jgi:DNA primase
MNPQDIKDMLTLNDITDILYELGGNPIPRGNELYCRTICHGGNKNKLVYYESSKTFHCFTDCKCSYDIFSLVSKVYNIDFASSIRYICGKFGINNQSSFDASDRLDLSFIKKFNKKEEPHVLTDIDTGLLNSFYKLYHRSWIEDGISKETMKKFNILYSINENKIIIPHFDIENRLLGIRARSLNDEEIKAGKKYMPIYHKGEVRKHPTGGNIYGLNITKESIKKYKTIILFESEKGVQQLDTMFPQMSIGGGISGSSLTNEQVKILQKMGIENVILALDKEFENESEEKFYQQKVRSGFIDKLIPYFRVSVIWDTKGLLDYKDAPTDKGKEVFQELFKNKILV